MRIVYSHGKKAEYCYDVVNPEDAIAATLSSNEDEREKLQKRIDKLQRGRIGGYFVIPDPPYGFKAKDIPGNDPLCSHEHFAARNEERATSAAKDMARTFQNMKPDMKKYTFANQPRYARHSTEDYGGHRSIFAYDDRIGGGWTCGFRRNLHNDKMVNKGTGLVSGQCGLVDLEKPSILSHWENTVMSLDGEKTPTKFQRPRLELMYGNMTSVHVDSCRGCSPNGMMTHRRGGRLMVSKFIEFKSSIVWYRNRFFIPFHVRGADDVLWLIGQDDRPGKGKRVIWHKCRASALRDLQPVGSLGVVVMGFKDGKLKTVPFSDEKRTPDHFTSSGSFDAMDFKTLVDRARSDKHAHPDHNEAERLKVYVLGSVPHKWYWFWGWRHAHWWEGDPMVERTHLFLQICGENVSSANSPSSKEYIKDWRNE